MWMWKQKSLGNICMLFTREPPRISFTQLWKQWVALIMRIHQTCFHYVLCGIFFHFYSLCARVSVMSLLVFSLLGDMECSQANCYMVPNNCKFITTQNFGLLHFYHDFKNQYSIMCEHYCRIFCSLHFKHFHATHFVYTRMYLILPLT